MITVTRKPSVYSTDLKVLQITGITLTPDFQPTIVSYTSSVVHNISETEVKAVTVDPRAELYINGNRALGGEVVPITLQVGLNRLEIKVQTPDLLEQVYVVNVTRQEDALSETIDSLIQLFSRYAAGNEVRGPLVNQLGNAADQAKHHYDRGNSIQAIKHLENLLKDLNNNSMQSFVSSAAKASLQAYVSALIESWSNLIADE